MTTTFYPGELADIYLYTKDDGGTAIAATVNQLEILAPDRSVITTVTTGWTNPATGTYKYVYSMPTTPQYPYIIGRWKYTYSTLVDYEEVKALIKGA